MLHKAKAAVITKQTFVAISLVCAQSLQAMPYYRQDEASMIVDAAMVANSPILSGTTLFADHEPTNRTIYVSPSNKKAQTGQFQIETTPACAILANQYALTFAVPNTPLANWQEVAKTGGFFSPYFDLHYANFVRNAATLTKMSNIAAEIDGIMAVHRAEVIAFNESKSLYEASKGRADAADAAYKGAEQSLRGMLESISLAIDAETKRLLQQEFIARREQFAIDQPRLLEDIRAAKRELMPLEQHFAAAKAAYKAVIPDLADKRELLAFYQDIYLAIEQSSQKTFTVSNKLLHELESTRVGSATAAFTVWGDEESALRSILQSSGSNYAAARLPIFNVRFKPTSFNYIPASTLSTDNGLTILLNNRSGVGTVGESADTTRITSGQVDGLSIHDVNGEPQIPIVNSFVQGSADTFAKGISRGAYCTGDSERKVEELAADFRVNATAPLQTARIPYSRFNLRNTPIFSQAIAIDYDFTLKTDPTNVTCTMEIERFRSWVSSKGGTGFLFWRRSWSDEQRNAVDQSGLKCTVEIAEGVGETVAEANVRTEAIRQAMLQDISAEFILTYAKSYELSTFKEAQAANPGPAAAQMGQSMAVLCGANVYCQVGSIILKNGNELFGTNRGSSQGSDFFKSTISRSYSQRSYMTRPGSATVDLTVNL